MRKLGYILLIGGFLWLSYDAIFGFARHQYSVTSSITKSMEPWGEQVSRPMAYRGLWDLYDDLKARYRLILLPAFMMLAGGLMLRAPKKPSIVVNRVFSHVQDIQSKVDEVRRDYAAFRQPEKSVGYRTRLLRFARTIIGSAYFRARKPTEHGDTEDS